VKQAKRVAAKPARKAVKRAEKGADKRPVKKAAPARRKRTGISAYRRVAAVLRRRITSGELQRGDRVPPLDELVKEFRVGRVTVRHALDMLADEGLIARHRDRRGSSVIGQPLDRRWFTLALDVAELGTHLADIAVTEIDSRPWRRPLPVSPDEGKHGASYQRIVHLHHHKDFPHPVGLTDLLIDEKLFRKLEEHPERKRPILERLAVRHADLGQIQQTFTIGEADIELARRLGVHESASIAELRRVIKDSSGKIVYFGHLYFRGDLVRLDFSVDLKRK
jgi:GntR family transcriptional regulator